MYIFLKILDLLLLKIPSLNHNMTVLEIQKFLEKLFFNVNFFQQFKSLLMKIAYREVKLNNGEEAYVDYENEKDGKDNKTLETLLKENYLDKSLNSSEELQSK